MKIKILSVEANNVQELAKKIQEVQEKRNVFATTPYADNNKHYAIIYVRETQ